MRDDLNSTYKRSVYFPQISCRFMSEFISDPMNGPEVLARFVRDTQNLLIEQNKLANTTSAEKQATLKKHKYFETVKREQVRVIDIVFLRPLCPTETKL